MSERTEAVRRAVRKVIRDARDKNKWRKIVRFRLWMPVALQILLIAIVLGYTNSRFPGFINETTISQILILALPLIVAAMAQNHALLVGYLDLSVGGMISLGVVIASFLIGAEASVSRDRDRRRGHPALRRRPRSRQRRPDPRTQGPLDHRHPGHVQHPGRDLADVATDRPRGHQPRPGIGAHHEDRTDPRGVHRRRRRGDPGRRVAPCVRGRDSRCGRSGSTSGRRNAGGSGPTGSGSAPSSSSAVLAAVASFFVMATIPDRQSARSGRRSRSTASPPPSSEARPWQVAGPRSSGGRWPRSSSRSSSPSCRTSVCHRTTDR